MNKAFAFPRPLLAAPTALARCTAPVLPPGRCAEGELAAFGECFSLRDSRARKALKRPLFRLCFDELFPCMFIWNLIVIKRAQWRDCGRAQGAGRAQCGALSLPPGRCAAGRRQRARVSPSSLGKHGVTAGWWQGSRACSRTAGSVPAQAGLEMGHDVGRMHPGSLAPRQHPYLHPTSVSHISVPHPHPHQHLDLAPSSTGRCQPEENPVSIPY